MRRDIKKKIRVISLCSLALLIGFYSFYQARFLLQGPDIEIWNPENGSSTKQEVVEIQGQAKNISYISLDGRQIFVNEQGVFKERILLSEGKNSVTITAQDKFGRERNNTIDLFFKQTEENTLTKK
jgi:hypothetical protein